jgi:hypothetical protein
VLLVEANRQRESMRDDLYWTEIRANKLAKKYFEKYYGVDWNMLFHIWGWKN